MRVKFKAKVLEWMERNLMHEECLDESSHGIKVTESELNHFEEQHKHQKRNLIEIELLSDD